MKLVELVGLQSHGMKVPPGIVRFVLTTRNNGSEIEKLECDTSTKTPTCFLNGAFTRATATSDPKRTKGSIRLSISEGGAIMKKASCVLALLWIILSISSVNAVSRRTIWRGDDRRSLKNNTPLSLTTRRAITKIHRRACHVRQSREERCLPRRSSLIQERGTRNLSSWKRCGTIITEMSGNWTSSIEVFKKILQSSRTTNRRIFENNWNR